MHIEPGDHKPDSLFYRRPVDVVALVVGGIVALGVYGSLGGLLLLTHLLVPSLASGTHAEVIFDTAPPEVEMITYEEVRLIKLGRQFDTRELPNRIRAHIPPHPRVVVAEAVVVKFRLVVVVLTRKPDGGEAPRRKPQL